MRVRLVLLVVFVAGCSAPAAELEGSSTVARVSTPPGAAVLVDPTRWSGEPSILALADGTLLITGAGGMTRYVEDPSDAPGNAGQSYLWRSEDGGASWSFVDFGVPDALASLLPYRNAIFGVEGDLAQDEVGRAYFVDLLALVGNGLSASDDSGRSWTAVQSPLVGRPYSDRPWVAAYGDGVVYVKYLSVREHRVARSTDGGRTFLEDVSLPLCGQGPIVVDVVAREALVPCAVGATLSIVRSPEGAQSWERLPLPDARGPATNVFVSMAVARSGQYLYTWSEQTQDGAIVKLVASGDRGVTWSAPVQMSAPNRTAVFPWVDANVDGVVGVVWYEADANGPPNQIDAAWRPMHARLDMDEAGALAVRGIAPLSEEAIHQGAICVSGLACVLAGQAEDRRLLDFFEVDVDPAGVSHVAWTNTRTSVPTIWYGRVV